MLTPVFSKPGPCTEKERKVKSKIPACGLGEAIGMIVYRVWYPALIRGHHNVASTYEFPVRIKFIEDWGACNAPKWNVPNWIQCAKELEKEGVAAITTNCGLTGTMQEELANAVNIPVFTSSLLQVPFVYRMLRKDKKVGILIDSEAAARRNDNELLRSCGIDESIPIVLYGMGEHQPDANDSQFGVLSGRPVSDYDPKKVEEALVSLGNKMVAEHPDVGAIVLECTEMPLYAAAVREATGLLVFDSTTLVRYVYHAIVKKHYF